LYLTYTSSSSFSITRHSQHHAVTFTIKTNHCKAVVKTNQQHLEMKDEYFVLWPATGGPEREVHFTFA
jgi:hypothetical protein